MCKSVLNIFRRAIAVVMVIIVIQGMILSFDMDEVSAAETTFGKSYIKNGLADDEKNISHKSSGSGRLFEDSLGRSEGYLYNIVYRVSGYDGEGYTYFTGDNVNNFGGYYINLIAPSGNNYWYGKSTYRNGKPYTEEARYSFEGIELKDIWMNNDFRDASGNSYVQVNIVIKNNNSDSKIISIGTGADLEVGGITSDETGKPVKDDDAYVNSFGNGFTMSNRFHSKSKRYGGVEPTVDMNIYTNHISGVTDADAIYIDRWFDVDDDFIRRNKGTWSFDSKLPANILGNLNYCINNNRHEGYATSTDAHDVAMMIAWYDRTIEAGETLTFSYILGVNEYIEGYDAIVVAGDNGIDTMTQSTVLSPDTIFHTTAAFKEGYEFDYVEYKRASDTEPHYIYNWNMAHNGCANGTNCVSFTMTEDIVITYYSKPVEYSITYNLDGGWYLPGKDNPATYTIESPDIVLNNPVKGGFRFFRWEGEDTNAAIPSGSTGNRDYTALWRRRRYILVKISSNRYGATFMRKVDAGETAVEMPGDITMSEWERYDSDKKLDVCKQKWNISRDGVIEKVK